VADLVQTLPYQAEASDNVTCGNVTWESFVAFWHLDDPQDCVFASWEVQVRLLPRLAGRTGDFDRFEIFAEGGDWRQVCSHTTRSEAYCAMDSLLSGREYEVRIQEQCTLKEAVGAWAVHRCSSEPVPAVAPVNIVADAPELYSFDVSWVASGPRACVFLAWEVQATVNGSSWAPSVAGKANDACWVEDRSQSRCTLFVGLQSNLAFEVRVRERCTRDLFQAPGPALTEPLPRWCLCGLGHRRT
jgi:hypothetical protein